MKLIFVSLILTTFLSLTVQGQMVVESHMFGHSLMDHASPTAETKIAYWIQEFATEAGHTYKTAGQFGSIWDFANFNPSSNWGYAGMIPSWDSEVETFGEASLNNILFTPFNYVQDLPPNVPYYSNPPVLLSSQRHIDSVLSYQDPIEIFIYENWPDMAPFTSGTFDPTPAELANYHSFTLGNFHDWWLQLHDSILISHPAANIHMIPVGPVVAELLTMAPYNTIVGTDLYEDDAPHGLPSIYFLAGLATYMAYYEEKALATYTIPSTIHPTIANNFNDIVDFMWDYFQDFDDDNGNNRVFASSTPPPDDADNDGIADSVDNCPNTPNTNQADYDMDGTGDLCDTPDNKVIVEQGTLYTNDAEGILMKGRDGNCYLLYISAQGVFTIEPRPCGN